MGLLFSLIVVLPLDEDKTNPGICKSNLGYRGKNLQDQLEKVQNREARCVTGNYNYETGSMTKILEQLKWETLKKKWKGSRLILI